MTVDELIKLWREYREEVAEFIQNNEVNYHVSFDDFIKWLERNEATK